MLCLRGILHDSGLDDQENVENATVSWSTTDKVRACWQKSITWRSCLGGRLTIWLCGRVPISSSQRVGIGKSQIQSCRVRTRSLSSWGSTWVPGLRQSEMQAQAEEINKKAASLVISFDSNNVKVGHHLSSHPGTGEELDWSNPIESPQLSRYTACTCGRVWPYRRKGSATLKTLHSFPSFLWFPLYILATRCHGPKGLSVFSWVCRDVEFWDMWLFKSCQGHAMPCCAMPCQQSERYWAMESWIYGCRTQEPDPEIWWCLQSTQFFSVWVGSSDPTELLPWVLQWPIAVPCFWA